MAQAESPPVVPRGPAATIEAVPAPYLPSGCPPGIEDVHAWKRITPSQGTEDQRFSVNYSPCTWSVSIDGSTVRATPHEKPKPIVPPGFVLPETWAPPRVAVQARSGFLLGFNKGEWGGALLFYSHDGRLQETLIDDNIVGILPTPSGFVVLAGLSHLGLDGGSATELTYTGDSLRIGRSVELGTAPCAMLAEPDGAILIAATRGLLRLTQDLRIELLIATRWGMYHPTSVAIDGSGTAYVGMRFRCRGPTRAAATDGDVAVAGCVTCVAPIGCPTSRCSSRPRLAVT